MTYEKLIELVLQGKSVNSRSKELGMPQKTLDQYVKANHIPGCDTALVFAEATGLPVEEVVRTIAAKKAETRPQTAFSFRRQATAAVLGFLVSVNLLLTPTPSQAAPVLTSQVNELYIM